MTIKINYKNKNIKKNNTNYVLFVDEKFNLTPIKKYVSSSEFSYINDILKTYDLKKRLFLFELSSRKKFILVSIKKNIKSFEIENLGAELFRKIKSEKRSEYLINTDSVISKNKDFIAHFLHGLKLKSYEFKKYKSKKDTRHINIV